MSEEFPRGRLVNHLVGYEPGMKLFLPPSAYDYWQAKGYDMVDCVRQEPIPDSLVDDGRHDIGDMPVKLEGYSAPGDAGAVVYEPTACSHRYVRFLVCVEDREMRFTCVECGAVAVKPLRPGASEGWVSSWPAPTEFEPLAIGLRFDQERQQYVETKVATRIEWEAGLVEDANGVRPMTRSEIDALNSAHGTSDE